MDLLTCPCPCICTTSESELGFCQILPDIVTNPKIHSIKNRWTNVGAVRGARRSYYAHLDTSHLQSWLEQRYAIAGITDYPGEFVVPPQKPNTIY